jgi:bacillithiol biosynthesis cysteine-adding enzyme BshC
VIPIFWVAGDDHDFEEVNHAYVLDRETEVREVAYKTPPEKQVSTAYVTFGDQDELARAKEQLREYLGDTDFTSQLYDLIDRTYTSEETFASAFGKLMSAFMRDTGLILFCPGDEDAKKFGAPFLKQVIEKQDSLQAAIGEANDEITGLGYHLQVEKKDNAAHLFYDLDGRKPVMRDGDGFTVDDRRFSREELLALVDERPERFSPDVLTRPIFQSYLFPTISQKSGPAELAYLAQIYKAFELFERPVPVYYARPTVTIVEKRFEKMMEQYDISFEDLTGDIEQVVNRVLARSFPENLDAHVEQLKRDVEERFERFMKESLEFDPSLREFGKQIYGKIDYNLKAFEGKVFSSHKKKSKDTRERIYRIWHALFPNRGLQERTLNLTYFISKYGFDFVTFLADRMDSEESSHQLLNLSEWDN